MAYPISVYSWNRYSGDEPQVSNSGLPAEFAGANLPVIVPVNAPDAQSNNDELPYSPVLMEQGVGPVAAPPAQIPTPPTASQAQAVPLKTKNPPLWNTIARAVFGGAISTSSVNSSASVAAGSSTLSTGS